MSVTSNELKIISSIYDAAIDFTNWTEVLERVANSVDACGSALFASDPLTPEFSINSTTSIWTPELLSEYTRKFHEQEAPDYLNLNRYPARQLMYDDDILRGVHIASELPARKWMKETMGISHRAAARLHDKGVWFDVLAFQYKLKKGGDDNRLLRKSDPFMDHLAKVLEINRPFMVLQQRFQAILAVLNRYHVGVFILNSSKQIVIQNEEADRIIDAGKWFYTTKRGTLAAKLVTDNKKLHAATERAVCTAEGADACSETILTITSDRLKDPLLLDVCPARDVGAELNNQFRGAFVFAIDPSQTEHISSRGMDILYGLTAAEMEVLDLLLLGSSTSEIAHKRETSNETVRSHIKSIMRKSQTRSRIELVGRAVRVNLPIDRSEPT